jgi:hypothetical protein
MRGSCSYEAGPTAWFGSEGLRDRRKSQWRYQVSGADDCACCGDAAVVVMLMMVKSNMCGHSSLLIISMRQPSMSNALLSHAMFCFEINSLLSTPHLA